jgi:hypothetical protein
MNDYCLFIPFVNRPDLLRRGVESVRNFSPVIIDNSSADERWSLEPLDIKFGASIVKPSVPLTFAQTMNFVMMLAERQNAHYCLVIHDDAEAGVNSGDMLLTMCREHNSKGKWGAIFTNYDSFVALNVAACKAVGPWDANLPQYFSDCDYYRRLRLAGYQTLDSGLPVKHEPSQTINSDKKLKFLNSITFPLYRQYYIAKWGGQPGHETFEKPFDGRCPE